jgi:signal transduction histidine kinase
MNDLKLFDRTRQKLAIYYASVMCLILAILGFQAYHFTAYERQQAIDREIESIAGTIHDSLESRLVKDADIGLAAKELIPNLCLVDLPCVGAASPLENRDPKPTSQHLVGFLNQGRYYLILLNRQGEFIATAGMLPVNLDRLEKVPTWLTITDNKSQNYRQFSTTLHTIDRVDRGELRIGRNIDDISRSLRSFASTLVIILPISLLIIGGAGWYLAGIAIRPIYLAYERQQLFTANVAHELRTPLSTTQLTLDEYISEYAIVNSDFNLVLDELHRQNSRSIRIVADLLLLARLDRAKIIDKDCHCHLDEIVEDLVEEYSALVKDRQIILTIEPISRPIVIKGDADRIARAISNLLDNATKYTSPDGKIRIDISSRETHINLTIADTGIGIDPRERLKIFDPFYRVNCDRSRQSGGTGLGLAIVKSIADLYDAKLQVDSKVGLGSTFSIDFIRAPYRIKF